jgi:predicted O-methyltransferase YrrM
MKQASDLLKYFPDAKEIRRIAGDVVYGDKDNFPGCGFMSMAESEILLATSIKHRGQWLEIGSHVGWSAAVIAYADNPVAAVDPEYAKSAKSTVRARALANLDRAGLLPLVDLIGKKSKPFYQSNKERFTGILIDGCHDHPEPLNDAIGAAKTLTPHGVIVLHDAKGQPIKDAIDYLAANGFTVTIHDTINGLAVCER